LRTISKKYYNVVNSEQITINELVSKIMGFRKIYNHNSYLKRKNNPIYRRMKLGIDSKSRTRVREELMEILGGCMCCFCGYSQDFRALQIDHKYSDGHKDIIKFSSNAAMYRYYRDKPNIAKARLQVLCANCNMIKRHTNREWGNKIA